MNSINVNKTITGQHNPCWAANDSNRDWSSSSKSNFCSIDTESPAMDNTVNMSLVEQLPSLPDNSLFYDILSNKVKLPEDTYNRLPPLPDHVREARHQCTIQFIEQALLPRIQDPKPLSVIELVKLATEYKTAFKSEHPYDLLGNFELIASVEMALLELQLRGRIRGQSDHNWRYTTQIIKRAALEIKILLDSDAGEELLGV